MTDTGRLRLYRQTVLGWLNGTVQERQIDLLVRTLWLTKEQGEEIKALPRGDQQAADQLLQRYILENG